VNYRWLWVAMAVVGCAIALFLLLVVASQPPSADPF
jgi:hypothetical protein